MALQMVEVNEHKYYISDQMDYDVGMEFTLHDWAKTKYEHKDGTYCTHAERFRRVYEENFGEVKKACSECGADCCGILSCVLAVDELHKILRD
jgi:hypothetical protein